MATNIRNVVKLYQNLKQEWNKKPPNLPKCGECLSELKLALTELTFLPSNDENATKQVSWFMLFHESSLYRLHCISFLGSNEKCILSYVPICNVFFAVFRNS